MARDDEPTIDGSMYSHERRSTGRAGARGRAGRRRVRREARAPARVARTGRDATARRGPAARAPNGVLRDDGGWDPRAGPHSENTPATDDIANGRRKQAARARSIGRYTYRTGARPATPLPKKVRRAATRCGWRRGAVDGVRYVLHARFGCWQAESGMRCSRVVLPGNAREALARAVHADSRRTLGAATRAAMEALMTAAILSTDGRVTGGGWVLEYRRCRARSPSYRLAREANRPRRPLIGRGRYGFSNRKKLHF